MGTSVRMVKRISVMVQQALSVQKILLLQIVEMDQVADRVWIQEFKSLDCSLLRHRLI